MTGTTAFAERYEFGIPVLNSSCACICGSDCSGGTKSLEYCKDYNKENDLCIAPISKSLPNVKDCAVKFDGAYGCCELKIQENLIEGPFTTFQVLSDVEYFADVLFFQNFKSLNNGENNELNVNDDTFLPINKPITSKYFEKAFLKSSIISQVLDNDVWYLDFSQQVQTTTLSVNDRGNRNIKKLGWLRYNNGKYELDGVTKDELTNYFEVEFEKCDKSGLKSAQFHTPRYEDFKSSLSSVSEKDRNVKSMKIIHDGGTGTHGRVEYTFNAGIDDLSMEIRLKVVTHNRDKITIKKYYKASTLGEFTAVLVMTDGGERYIRLNLTGTMGLINGIYRNDKDGKGKHFSFDCVSDPFVQYITSNTLECSSNINHKICLFTDNQQQNENCKTMPCQEEELLPDENIQHVIDVDAKEVLDPMNWRSWVKFANPLEWFNGISSYQEAVMMALEVIGFVAGIGMVLRILKMFNLLGKCCRFMWCCCLCPKFEKKVKSKTRRMTRTLRRRYTEKSVRFSSTTHSHRVRTETALERSLHHFRKSVLKKVFNRHLSEDNLMEQSHED